MTGLLGRMLESNGRCDECGKDHEGNYLLEGLSDGKVKVTCDKCRRLHTEADRLMGVLQVWDIETGETRPADSGSA